jgi:ABC-type multidrug transport system fused ATPase/permease subunit
MPEADPGLPDHRSAPRYLWWIARGEARTLGMGIVVGIVWMLAQAFLPFAMGRAIDTGVTGRNVRELVLWAGVLLGLGLIQALAGVLRHRLAVTNFLAAAYRTLQVTIRQATGLGATLPRRLASGEVIAVGVADVANVASAFDIAARGAGSVVAIGVIGVILLTTSVPLGLVVLIGVPLMAAVVAPALRPLHHRQMEMRERQGELTGASTDIVAGLRVLRGIGGEQVMAARYRGKSQDVRRSGVRVGRADALIEALEALLPGLLIAVVTWLGARFAVAGTITVGQLVSFYAYAVFLVEPLGTIIDFADRLTKANVAARRIVRILRLRPEPAHGGDTPVPAGSELRDAASGLTVAPGLLTAVVTAVPEEAERIADRLGRFTEGDVTWGGIPISAVPLAEVRRRIIVAVNDDRLFTGILRDELGGGDGLVGALVAACAEDILEGLPEGLDTTVAEGGREFSGGQQQRLRLVRAFVADPEVLILIEPTSAVDAHTEARVAARFPGMRSGRTTVIATSSPLVLEHADTVAWLEDGRLAATGTHHELLMTVPAYAAAVTRDEATTEPAA